MDLDIEQLNADCACITLDRAALGRALGALTGDRDFASALEISHPHLLSNVPVFLNARHFAEIAKLVAAIERVALLPGYRKAVGAANFEPQAGPAPPGVFMGYDFHLGRDGPKLIEINTNAGGALINAIVASAQTSCCRPGLRMIETVTGASQLGARFVANFNAAFARQRGTGRTLTSIAIVDDAPERQYLYPEFVLFQRLFEQHATKAVIAAPEALSFDGEALRVAGFGAVDLVYNRLTDFKFGDERHSALAAAYKGGAVVVTPNPLAYQTLADKSNLVLLTDPAFVESVGACRDDAAALRSGIPRTRHVTAETADALWAERDGMFFKPTTGYGSRAAYRGDKITRRVWEHISAGGYVAQDLVTPSTRHVIVDGVRQALKVDIRGYTYDGRVDLVAARVYQGQTTNMRTPGGGFAPVLSNDVGPISCGC